MKKTSAKEKEIIDLALKYCKEVDESPFIMKSNNFLWRLAGGKMSQAEYLKKKIMLEAKNRLLEIDKL